MTGSIIIKGLEVVSRLGVPADERAEPQRLEVDVVLEADLRDLRDDSASSTDYAAVAAWVVAPSSSKPTSNPPSQRNGFAKRSRSSTRLASSACTRRASAMLPSQSPNALTVRPQSRRSA